MEPANGELVFAFGASAISTTVTASGVEATAWINETILIHHSRLPRLIVGIEAEFQTSTMKVAALMLCVGHRCLIFRIIHADHIPDALNEFLSDPLISFVGFSVRLYERWLFQDYDMPRIVNAHDPRYLLLEMGNWEIDLTSLETVAWEVLGIIIQTPASVSRWDGNFLTVDQAFYASVNAFVSFKLGLWLLHGVL